MFEVSGVIEYIAADSPSRVYETLNKIKEKVSYLHSFPDRGRSVRELQDQGIAHYRELIFMPWRSIYRVSEGTVHVLSVLDSRQNVEDLLLQRLLGPRL